jgi:hypothetical protein
MIADLFFQSGYRQSHVVTVAAALAQAIGAQA